MEFVGNKKTACFCGASNCSGLIGEKPKEIEKKLAPAQKKKSSKKRTVKRANRQQPVKRIAREDPFVAMLENMPMEVDEDEQESEVKAESEIKPELLVHVSINNEVEAPDGTTKDAD
jgi:hypothetical protein